jgi:hypothetical protein
MFSQEGEGSRGRTPTVEPGVMGDHVPVPKDALTVWTDAHRAYVSAVEAVLAKGRPESHDLDVVEALAWEARRALAGYRVSRGERER